MRNVKDLNLDEQNKRNKILKRLNELANLRDPLSLAEKQSLMHAYIDLMQITEKNKMEWQAWHRKIEEVKKIQRQAWEVQRISRHHGSRI